VTARGAKSCVGDESSERAIFGERKKVMEGEGAERSDRMEAMGWYR
jgi:hypothetical protein